MLSLQRALQYFAEVLWSKTKDTFITKEDAVNGVLLDPKWELVNTVQNNTEIILPSLDTFDELYIEMNNNTSTIVHQVNIKKESLLSNNKDITYRELILDTLYNAESYVTYYTETNVIIPTYCEGFIIDDTTNITTSVYIKRYTTSDITTLSSNIISYDDSVNNLGVNNIQEVIGVLINRINDLENRLNETN